MESGQKSVRLGWRTVGRDLWAGEIFKRVPIKTLGQCRCVCKEWNSLISSPFCISSHHSFTASSTPIDRQQLIIGEYNKYSIYHPQEVPLHYWKLGFPFRFRDIVTPDNLEFQLVDVINGVVCVSYSLSSSFDSTIFWNPAIRRYVALPRLQMQHKKALEIKMSWELSHFQPNAIGFGYQISNRDFKVVRVWIPSSSSSSSSSSFSYEVFSSQLGLWREAKAKPFTGFKYCGFFSPATSCFLNGTVHWLLSTSNSNSNDECTTDFDTYSLRMLLFDCEREEFTTMELPEELNRFQVAIFRQGGNVWMTRIVKYSGMLGVLLHSKKEARFELWAIKEDTNWNKLFSVNVDFMDLCYMYLPMVTENGHFLEYNLDSLFWDDPNTGRSADRFYQPLNCRLYEESMFLMDGGKSYTREEAVDILVFPPSSMKRWRRPPIGWIKLNIHGALRCDEGTAGGVFRDDQGRFVKAFSLKMKGESAIEVQLKGLYEGLLLADQTGFMSFIVETDAIEVVRAVKDSNYAVNFSMNASSHSVECHDLMTSRIDGPDWRIGIGYAPRESNKVAHWFAKTGMKNDGEQLLVFNHAPSQVEQFIASDL